MREIVNAIPYQTRTGCQWRYLPRDLPPYGAVDYYFTLWRTGAHDNQIGTTLLARVAAENPGVSKAFVDAGFKDEVAIHGAMLGIDVETVSRLARRRQERRLRRPVRISLTRVSGCSRAAKWPPLSAAP
jgi:transposase